MHMCKERMANKSAGIGKIVMLLAHAKHTKATFLLILMDLFTYSQSGTLIGQTGKFRAATNDD